MIMILNEVFPLPFLTAYFAACCDFSEQSHLNLLSFNPQALSTTYAAEFVSLSVQ